MTKVVSTHATEETPLIHSLLNLCQFGVLSCLRFTYFSYHELKSFSFLVVNYPTTKDDWASCFTAICLLLPLEVRSLTIAPHVYSQVPYEVFKSYTDYANMQNLFLIAKWSPTSHKLKICGFYAPFDKFDGSFIHLDRFIIFKDFSTSRG